MIEYLLGACGAVCIVLLGFLINQISTLFTKNDDLRKDFIEKMDDLKKTMNNKMNTGDCRTIRGECIELNKRLIHDPLVVQLEAIRLKSSEQWNTYETQHRKLWDTLDGHTHSQIQGNIKDDEVIYKK
jgi:hypothetical protein